MLCVRLAAFLSLATALPGALPATLAAQPRWRAIGRTVVGNQVFVDDRSLKRAKGITTATFRVAFTKPVRSPRGEITSARTVVMLDCAKRHVAIRENTYYHDERTNRIYDHKVVGIPGWSAPMGGSMPEVAIGALCPR